jgi:uracil-DNA glycosylase
MDERLLLKEIAKIKSSWSQVLKDEASKDYFQKLDQQLSKLIQSRLTFYPPIDEVFSAFKLTDLLSTKVVILGQDPYHGPGQAHGLSFSVKKDVPLPPSLKNIYKELESDLGVAPSPHGDLTPWAKQGVFMLNSILTVEPGLPGSHQSLGWELFTDAVFRTLNEREKPLVFILWGAYAQKRQKLIDASKHLVLSGPHPSPLSCYRGFYGSKPFSKANDFLCANHITPIDWQLSH